MENKTREFINFFRREFETKFKTRYCVNFAKDGFIVKKLLAQYDYSTLVNAAKEYLDSKDDFYQHVGHTIGLFSKVVKEIIKQRRKDVTASSDIKQFEEVEDEL
ncbi:hypothetical protein LCGC14_2351800 [marine sediment metagenome]|uniref:Uncharacterized protein n=1 Tax=marine sediment metagenome TaxID=412755 RepID=A0A0F9C8Y8_9ZZZZ